MTVDYKALEGWNHSELEDRGTVFDALTRRSKRPSKKGCDDGHKLEELEVSSSSSAPQKTLVTAGQSVFGGGGQNSIPGAPGFDPHTPRGFETVDFGALESVKGMGTGRAAQVVGFDTEFHEDDGKRVVDSYQFATPDPEDPATMIEIVILPRRAGDELTLIGALWCVVNEARLWDMARVRAEVGPKGVAKRVFWDEKWTDADWQERVNALAKFAVPVVLACHFAKADLSTFKVDRYTTDHMTRVTAAAGGLVTLLPFRLQSPSRDHKWWKALSVTVRDTMAHAPAGKQSLKALGDACGVPKLEVPGDWISRMHEYREQHLADFLDYGVNDAVIVVEYLARMWGDGILPPVTLSGGAALSIAKSGASYFGLEKAREFRLAFAGLEDVDDGVVPDDDEGLSFYKARSRKPIDGAAETVMHAYALAYHGGLNACPAPGFYPRPTIDIDAQNAYPTAMASVLDVDWEAGVIDDVIHERELALDDVPEPTAPVVAYVSFEFPKSVAYPCIPVYTDNTLVYPRTSEGIAGTWVSGPELWLALKLGAKVTAQIGYKLRVMRMGDEPSRVLRHAVKQLIDDRNTAKKAFGKGSIEELTLKTAVNSAYGKTAQDVVARRAWNASAQEMGDVGGSAITSPYHAATTTSLVRAELLAVMNQISGLGGTVFSVTTDGFITDLDIETVASLDMYGLKPVLQDSRRALAGDSSIWEVKHHQSDLLNFTTRGNVSLEPNGVCAHNSLKFDGLVSDSREDREALLTAVVSRTGRVANAYMDFPSFRDLSSTTDRKQFVSKVIERRLSMDFDLKREPVFETIKDAEVVLPDGTTHAFAGFVTRAFETVGDCLKARRIGREIASDGCLRTASEWRDFEVRYKAGAGRRIGSSDRAILMSVVQAHRLGVIEIPELADPGTTVQEKLDGLERLGLGGLSKGDWKNARRAERASSMLPLEVIEPWVDKLNKTSDLALAS